MKQYIGTKLVNAKPMTRQEYNDLRGWTVPSDENPNDEGYLVEYVDGGKANHPDFAGYISWSPKDVFERAYTKTETVSRNPRMGDTDFYFGLAINCLKDGKRVARKGWNGKGMFLFLVKGDALTQAIEERYGDPEHLGTHKALDQIYLHTAQGDLVAWTASQTDILAEDWVLVE